MQVIMSAKAMTQLLLDNDKNQIFVSENAASAEKYLQIRDEWMEKGLVEQDFDGSIVALPELARILWTYGQAESAIRVRYDSTEIWWFNGIIEHLKVSFYENGTADLEVVRPLDVLMWLKEKGEMISQGELVARRNQMEKKATFPMNDSPEMVGNVLMMYYEDGATAAED